MWINYFVMYINQIKIKNFTFTIANAVFPKNGSGDGPGIPSFLKTE